MRKIIKRIFIGVLVLGLIAVIGIWVCRTFFYFSNRPSAINAAAESVVLVNCYDEEGNLSATGSGFIAFSDDIVCTNYHVISEGCSCEIVTQSNEVFRGISLVGYYKDRDIAFIRLESKTGLEVLDVVDSKDSLAGDRVIAIGSPLGLKNTVSDGIISGRIDDDNDVLSFTAPICKR